MLLGRVRRRVQRLSGGEDQADIDADHRNKDHTGCGQVENETEQFA